MLDLNPTHLEAAIYTVAMRRFKADVRELIVYAASPELQEVFAEYEKIASKDEDIKIDE